MDFKFVKLKGDSLSKVLNTHYSWNLYKGNLLAHQWIEFPPKLELQLKSIEERLNKANDYHEKIKILEHEQLDREIETITLSHYKGDDRNEVEIINRTIKDWITVQISRYCKIVEKGPLRKETINDLPADFINEVERTPRMFRPHVTNQQILDFFKILQVENPIFTEDDFNYWMKKDFYHSIEVRDEERIIPLQNKLISVVIRHVYNFYHYYGLRGSKPIYISMLKQRFGLNLPIKSIDGNFSRHVPYYDDLYGDEMKDKYNL